MSDHVITLPISSSTGDCKNKRHNDPDKAKFAPYRRPMEPFSAPNLCSTDGCKNERHKGQELCIVCIAAQPGNVLKCARSGCDNLKQTGHDFCLPCLMQGAEKPASNRCCDNLRAI
jgi:hypothetical protein